MSERVNEKILTPEGYMKRHKEAFRCAFDYLNIHFPPGDGDEWWEQAAKDVSAASVLNGENELVKQLLMGVYGYLESEWRLRYKRGEDG